MGVDVGEITIRAAEDSDEAGLIELIGGCFATYENCVLAVDEEMPELRRMASYHAEIGGRAWVATDGEGAIVGSVAALPAGADGVELKKLYVASRARRRGLGARLCGLVEGFAAERGASFVELWSDTRFLDAHRLYERVGYVRDGRTRELHDLSGSVEYYFRKTLAAGQRPRSAEEVRH